MHRSKIEWVLNPDNKTLGWVWNPITGCLNHTNGMCKGGNFPCYAYRLANTRLKERYLANDNIALKLVNPRSDPVRSLKSAMDIRKALEDPFYPRFWEDRLYHDWSGRPKGIFACDMSDLFGIGIPEEWTADVLNLCRLHENNRYYLLTKQPQNLIKFSPFPENCWVGVTATSQSYYNEAIVALDSIKATVKYISCEPLLGQSSFHSPYGLDDIQWVIIGAQTRPTRMPKIEWVEEIVRAADKAGVPVFLKNNLWDLLYTESFDNDVFWANERATLRQELPNG